MSIKLRHTQNFAHKKSIIRLLNFRTKTMMVSLMIPTISKRNVRCLGWRKIGEVIIFQKIWANQLCSLELNFWNWSRENESLTLSISICERHSQTTSGPTCKTRKKSRRMSGSESWKNASTMNVKCSDLVTSLISITLKLVVHPVRWLKLKRSLKEPKRNASRGLKKRLLSSREHNAS